MTRPSPAAQPRTAYPSMRYRLASALQEAANLPEYNLSHRMMSVHGGPADSSYLDAADMILDTEPMQQFAIEAEARLPVPPLDVERLARAMYDADPNYVGLGMGPKVEWDDLSPSSRGAIVTDAADIAIRYEKAKPQPPWSIGLNDAEAKAWQQGYDDCWNRLNEAGRLLPSADEWRIANEQRKETP